ncbi:hypothetical protein CRE_27452 [Caenorhabditis remanei]|uniref:C6 domain-containing protein n=1 Tax=Caenorhabditis remanei TaxID=31234 RepID=E3LNN8_CAERE|nr:hypothetical protein CRE_27452 [Caenorhabditis remanei]
MYFQVLVLLPSSHMELATAPIRWSMDVTYSGYALSHISLFQSHFSSYSYSQISGSSDAISTMSVRCSALTDYNVYMQFNGCQGGPLNNQNFPEGNDITLTCNSADMVWNYVVTLNGITYTRRIISVTCQRKMTKFISFRDSPIGIHQKIHSRIDSHR